VKILLHICCAPCAIYPLKVLKEEFSEIMGLFYNPFIHPYIEFLRRLDAVKKFEKISNLKIIYKEDYDLEKFIREIVFREDKRCLFCYKDRLELTATIAKNGNFDYFTTTLLYSKFQKHEFIKELGEEIGKRKGVKFYYKDFRVGWKEGIEESKKLNLYRQQYCGCIFSEYERYKKYKSLPEEFST